MTLSACANISHQAAAPDEAVQVLGPAVRDNRTPLELAYTCYGAELRNRLARPLSIAVGSITDYTGKQNDVEGAAVTQGGSLMIFSALKKLGDAVVVHDRFDTRVTELELAYLDKRRLGDGRVRQIDGQQVPWLPYFGGTIAQSDVAIVGGITELNYNIQSGGAEFRIAQIGPKARTYTMNVAVDLRLVNTSSLVVESAVSVQKQLVGYDIGFETFRFFDLGGGPELFDVNLGLKSQEPLQLGVRATLEAAVLELLSDLTALPHEACLPKIWRLPEDGETPPVPPSAIVVEQADPPPPPVEAAPAAPADPLLDVAEVRFGVHRGFTRVVFALPEPAAFEVVESDGELVIRIAGARMTSAPPEPPRAQTAVSAARLVQSEAGLELRLAGRRPLEAFREFRIAAENGGVHRIVVDVGLKGRNVPPPPEPEASATIVAPASGAPYPLSEPPAAPEDDAASPSPASVAVPEDGGGSSSSTPASVLRGAPKMKLF